MIFSRLLVESGSSVLVRETPGARHFQVFRMIELIDMTNTENAQETRTIAMRMPICSFEFSVLQTKDGPMGFLMISEKTATMLFNNLTQILKGKMSNE